MTRQPLFGKKNAPGIMGQPTQSQTEPLPSNIYRSIDKLPFNKFVDCICDENLQPLIISGYPTHSQLQVAWTNIIQQYTEAIGNLEFSIYKKLYSVVSELSLKYDQIICLCGKEGILKVAYSRYLCNELNKLVNASFTFDYKDWDSYQMELARCEKRGAAIKIQLDLKLLQLYAIKKKSEGVDEKQDRAYYISIMIQLSNYAKFIIPETITLFEYCQRLKQYKQYIDSLNTKKS